MHARLLEKETLENKDCIVIDENKKVNQLEEENKSLQEKFDKLNTILAKFTKGSKNQKMCFKVKDVFLTKDVKFTNLKRTKSIEKITLLKPNNPMTLTINEIIVKIQVI